MIQGDAPDNKPLKKPSRFGGMSQRGASSEDENSKIASFLSRTGTGERPAQQAGKAAPTPPPQTAPETKKSGFQKMFEKFGALASGVFSKIASAVPKPKMTARYVPETPRDIAEKRGEFETEVDDFLRLVKLKKKLSLRDAALALGESEVVVEEWATILDRSGLVKLVYPGNPMESPYVLLREPGTNNRT